MTKMLAGVGLAALIATGAPAQDRAPGPPPAPRPLARADVEAMAQRQFDRIDANHDGIVTRAEYDAFEQARRAEHMARMKEHRDREFAKLDANHDGTLSHDEYDAGGPPPPPQNGADGAAPPPPPVDKGDAPPPPPPGDDDGGPGHHRGPMGRHGGPMGGGMMIGGPRWFEMADANHDGQVTLAEAKAAALAAFDRMDANHDGVLSPEEHRPMGPGGSRGDMPPPPPQDQ